MLEIVERSLGTILSWVSTKNKEETKTESDSMSEKSGRKSMKVIKRGPAMRVIFFYPGEEGTYVDHANVTLYENGIVHIDSNQEETTTHLQNCEILWRFETDSDERANKVRLLKPKAVDTHGDASSDITPINLPKENKTPKGAPRSPETVE
jgi:hypothetical protein